MEYDIVGDIHGNAPALHQLLARLGYRRKGLGWASPADRQLIFVGDIIDRGDGQVEAIDTVRSLVDSGSALAVMGNHELNAIAWHQGYRPDTAKNRKQHGAFLDQIGERSRAHGEAVEWFLTLPLWLDLPKIRIVHACWDPRAMKALARELGGSKLTEDHIAVATTGGSNAFDVAGERGDENEVFSAVETLLKGIEIELPQGRSFHDKDGHERRHVRLRWWLEPPVTYREASMTKLDPDDAAFERLIPSGALPSYDGTKPLFLGHYWRTGAPKLLSQKIACVDYSAGKGGPLVAYCWRGEEDLQETAFVSSETPQSTRADRFIWSAEEARVIFSNPVREEPEQRGVADRPVRRARILVAGSSDEHSGDIASALSTARDAVSDRFVVLERAGQFFIQCLCQEAGWLLEKREGDANRHFRGLVQEDSLGKVGEKDLISRIFGGRSEPRWHLDFDQVLEAMRCYQEEEADPSWLKWERFEI